MKSSAETRVHLAASDPRWASYHCPVSVRPWWTRYPRCPGTHTVHLAL